jgi:hypothetical protein
MFALPPDVQRDVRNLVDLFHRIETGDRPVMESLRAFSLENIGRKGYALKSLVNKFYAWKASGDWQCLVNKAKLIGKVRREMNVENATVSLPEDFIEYWRGLCEQNQRKSRPAYRELLRRYWACDLIKGYARRDSNNNAIPQGWSYRNLMRHAPTPFERTARRQGRSAAADYRPLVFSTRAGLKCGQFYVFDDIEHDLKVNLPGINRLAMRPLELACLDVYSGCKIKWGLKPTVIGDDGAKQKLKERDMRFLLAYILYRIGYRPEGTTLLVEHGTAAIREDVERALADATDGAIRVNRSGIEGAAAFAGAYGGRPKGNFRFKAALESHHNLVHNELAALPGQMGMDRQHSPEELHGRDAANNALLKAIMALEPERVAMLRLPFIPFRAFEEIIDIVYARINGRMEHHLEGWEESGLMVNEFRLAANAAWSPMSMLPALPANDREAVERILSKPGLVQCRRMSPAEVWNRDCGGLVKVRPNVLPAILGGDLAVERTVKDDHLFEFQDRDLSPSPLRYRAEIAMMDGSAQILQPGEKFMTFANPFDLSQLIVCDAQCAFLGLAPRWETVRKDDIEGLHRAMGAAAKMEKKLLEPVARRGAEVTRQRMADAQWNAQVLSGAPMTEEVSTARVSQADLAAVNANDEDADYQISAEEIASVLKG